MNKLLFFLANSHDFELYALEIIIFRRCARARKFSENILTQVSICAACAYANSKVNIDIG